MDYKLVWYSDQEQPPIITVWRPVAPAGYSPLSDVIVLGLDPPSEPVRCVHVTAAKLQSLLASWLILIVNLYYLLLIDHVSGLGRHRITCDLQDLQAAVVAWAWEVAAAAGKSTHDASRRVPPHLARQRAQASDHVGASAASRLSVSPFISVSFQPHSTMLLLGAYAESRDKHHKHKHQCIKSRCPNTWSTKAGDALAGRWAQS